MDTKYGFSEKEWQEAVREIQSILIEVAKTQDIISYSDLVHQMQTTVVDPHSYALANMLGDVCTLEHQNKRPLLSALVVYKDKTEAGPGFFEIAKELGYSIQDKDQFHMREITKCYEYWKINK